MDPQSNLSGGKRRKRKNEVIIKCSDGSEVRCGFYYWEITRVGKFKRVRIPVLGFDGIEWLIREIEWRRRKGYDAVVLITGDERVGKSTLAAHIAYRLGSRDPSKIVFNSMQALEAIAAAEEGEVIWLDEAGVALYSDEYFKREERNLIKAFQMVGMKRLVFILCLPHKELLAKKIRERRVTYWLDCYAVGTERGWARLRTPEKNEFRLDSWWTPQFSFHYPEFGTYAPYKRDGFDPAKFWAEYYQTKLERTESELDEYAGKQELKYRSKMVQTIVELRKGGYSWRQISEITGTDRSQIRLMLRNFGIDPDSIEAAENKGEGREEPVSPPAKTDHPAGTEDAHTPQQDADQPTPPTASDRSHLLL